MSKRPSQRDEFEVAIFCSDPLAYDAASLHFDEFWDEEGDPFGRSAGGSNSYTTGRIGRHNVVLALGLHLDETTAADAVAIMRLSYPALKLFILTGICDGVPFTGQAELLLGDVIISNAFVRCYDTGVKYENSQSQSQVYMSSNDVNIRNLFASLHTERGLHLLRQRTAYFLRQFRKMSRHSTKYQYPGAAEDKLFESTYRHMHRSSVTCSCRTKYVACEEALGTSCDDLGCDEEYLVARARLKRQNMRNDRQMPALHIGRVAAIEVILKMGEDRDVIAKTEGVIAFDHSSAWVLQDMPAILVKGVSNYADGHQKKKWQNYAAATAISAIQAILEVYTQLDNGQHVEDLPKGQFLVPIDRNPNFTGRQTLLSRLLETIRPGVEDWCRRTAIGGAEGVGKTQIALEAAYRVHDKHTDCSIFWVSARDEFSFEESYYGIGERLKVEGIFEDEANVKLLVKTALSEEGRGNWLLVIDDADALESLGLLAYLPFSRNGSILFTVQNLEAVPKLYISEQNVFPVDVLNIREAIELTQKASVDIQTSYTRGTKRLLDFLQKSVSNYMEENHWGEAEKLGREIMEILRKHLEDEHPDMMLSMHNLALIYERQSRLEIAEWLAVHVVNLRTKVLGADHLDTLSSTSNLASIYEKEGRLEEAERLARDVMNYSKAILGATHERTLESMDQLASIYMNQSRQEDASLLEVQILEIRRMKRPLLSQRSLLESEPKDAKGDSGYGSASRLAATTVPSASDLQNDIDDVAPQEQAEVEIDMPVQLDDDIRSVVSEGDDIRSQISDATTSEGMTGKALIRAFLAEQPHFKALCEKALAKMNRLRFIENMSRLLRSFHKGLAEEAKSEAEKVVTRLLRSKRGRRRISEQLAAHIDMEHEEAQDKTDLEIPSSKMQNVEDWLSQAMKPSSIEDVELAVEIDQDIAQDSDAMEMDSEDDNEPYSFPYISELKAFLLASKAFQSLQVRFALMFLSADLGDMLQSIPKESIWLSQEQDVSISNRLKILVENTTKVRWNWWPLSQGKRMLNPGESRLFWKCTCGVEQWEEISPEQREFVENILEWSDTCPSLASRCGVRKAQATLSSSIKGILNYTNGGQITRPSQAATRYTPQASSSSAPPQSVQLQPLAGAVPLQQQQGPIIGQQAQETIPNSNNSLQWWILFGVRGARRTLVPTQIHVTSQTTDSQIFQELKRCYRIYRGRLRLWLSIWRLEYCEVVRFSRLTPDRMVREYRELPSDKDYHYDPRAGERDVRNPPISPHHFQTLFYACQSPCTWPFPHDCIPLVTNTVNLSRIPKRTREFERDQSSPIWGFETVFAVSFNYVFGYHLVMVVGPFIFWGLWLKFHPDDLQNASVPITVVIGALSLFWSGAGILTSQEKE